MKKYLQKINYKPESLTFAIYILAFKQLDKVIEAASKAEDFNTELNAILSTSKFWKFCPKKEVSVTIEDWKNNTTREEIYVENVNSDDVLEKIKSLEEFFPDPNFNVIAEMAVKYDDTKCKKTIVRFLHSVHYPIKH